MYRYNDAHRNHIWSFSLPWENVLFCRHDMQFSHFMPAAEPLYWLSWQVMSASLVFDELGSDASRVGESIHCEAQGEFGVTCNATLSRLSRQQSKIRARGKRYAMVSWIKEG